jgi:hypothetical protein
MKYKSSGDLLNIALYFTKSNMPQNHVDYVFCSLYSAYGGCYCPFNSPMQMELLTPKLQLFFSSWQMGLLPLQIHSMLFQMAVWPPYITKSLLPFFLPSLLNEPTILDFGQDQSIHAIFSSFLIK